MTDATRTSESDLLEHARELRSRGEVSAALGLLTNANRAERSAALELALVDLRVEGGKQRSAEDRSLIHAPVEPREATGAIVEVDAADLTASAVHEGIARSGCLLVRGLVRRERAAELAAGIDEALAAYDA